MHYSFVSCALRSDGTVEGFLYQNKWRGVLVASNWELETPEYLRHGMNIFQYCMLADDEKTHVDTVISIAGYKPAFSVCDIGCGIGFMADSFIRWH